MATVTRTLGILSDAQGATARFELDYDDATLRAATFRCVNGFAGSVSGAVERESDGLTYERIFAVGTTTVTIPTGPAARITLAFPITGAPATGYRVRMG